MATNIGVISSSPFAGLLSTNTASFFKLIPGTNLPIELLADIIPGITPNRVTVDMVDVENYNESYRVTQNVLQDFSDTTSNVHKNLISLSITGTITDSLLLPLGAGGVPAFGIRFDKIRMANLEAMAAQRRPIMVVTPRVSLATCFITNISRPWTPATGHATVVTINMIEARISSPSNFDVLPDTATLAAGNTAAVGGGEQAATPVTTPAVTQPPVAQLPPNIGGLANSPETI